MTKICIIRGFPNRTDMKGSFVNAHEEMISGEIVVLDGYYPSFTYKGRTIRYFYSKNLLRMKLLRILPQFLYHRFITSREFTEEAIHDSIEGFVRKYKVQVILAEFGNVGAAICKHAKALGIPLIVHFHGHDAHRTPFLVDFKESYKEMFEHAYKLVSVSHYMTQALINMGADPNKIVYNPYGPREIFFDSKPTYQKTILAVGRFTDIKANHLVIMAFRNLLEEVPDVKLVMIGDGELLETCKGLVKMWGMGECVQFLGSVRHDEIAQYFEQACCFVQHSVVPTYGDAEGTPVAILEAGASALPVVSTRHAGIVDAVVHGETGFLVEERDVERMSSYMQTLVQDKSLCKEMGQKAREHVRRNYSIGRHIGCLQALVDEAANIVGKL